MEALPTPSPPPPPYPNYPDKVDCWDEPFPPPPVAKLRLMCSYGGHIVPRPSDKSLCYVGGDTRIVAVPRHTSLSDLSMRLAKSFFHDATRPFVIKYQLPSEDLDSLVSVATDEDLENMIDEYDQRIQTNNSSANKASRIRLFLFPAQPNSVTGLGSVKSEEWLSGSLDGGLSESALANCLPGLDEEVATTNVCNDGKVSKEVHDSPVLESNSSFGSASSVPNLPPIKVHVVEDGVKVAQDQKGIEEQFVKLGVRQRQEESFVSLPPPPPPPLEFVANRIVSDDERSDRGVPVGYAKPRTPQPQPQAEPQPPQFQQKSGGPVDLPSPPDSFSSDSSLSSAMSCPKPAIYQEQVQIQSGNSQVPGNTMVDSKLNVTDPLSQIQMQPQFNQQPLLQQHQTQQPQQFIHSTHIIHHTPAGPVPIPSAYYPVYQQQLHPQHHHHLDQQYPVYYLQARPTQAYNLSVQPANVPESATTVTSNQSQNMRKAPLPKSEKTAGAYRTAPAAPQLVQVPPTKHQQQYVAYSQIHHHHPQSAPPNSTIPANYAYNYSDPAHAQMFYTQPLAPSIPSQYQTMTPAAVALPEVSTQLPSNSMNQQVRTSQPL